MLSIKIPAEENEIDLRYRFRKEFWGSRYATEAAFACIKYWFERLNINRIVGRAEMDNVGPRVVLEKCGMKYSRQALWTTSP